jgi:hypothetical protein
MAVNTAAHQRWSNVAAIASANSSNGTSTRKDSTMTRQSQRKPGRPQTLGKDAVYLTVKLRGDQFKAINRLAGSRGRLLAAV